MDKLKMCIAYRYRGKETEYAPLDAQGWDECEPVYLEFPGWSENTHGVTRWDDLPPAARAYLRALEALAGRPTSIARKSVVQGKRVSVRVEHGGRRILKKK